MRPKQHAGSRATTGAASGRALLLSKQLGRNAAAQPAQAAEFSGRVVHTTVLPRQSSSRPSSPTWRVVQRGKTVIVNSTDYTASASDEGVLRLPGRTELEPGMVSCMDCDRFQLLRDRYWSACAPIWVQHPSSSSCRLTNDPSCPCSAPVSSASHATSRRSTWSGVSLALAPLAWSASALRRRPGASML